MTPSLMRPASIASARKLLQRLAQAALRLARRDFEQHVPGIGRRQRIDDAGDVLQRHVDAEARDQLEGGELIAARLACAREQLHRVFDARQARGRRSRRSRGAGKSCKVAAVMMPSVPSRADEELLQIVAGIVLAQRAQAVPDAPVGQHDFETEHQRRAYCRSAAPAMPPALVEILPPIWQRAFGAEAQGKQAIDRSRPPSARRRGCTPASTVIV